MSKRNILLSFIKGVITGIGSLLSGIGSGSLIISFDSYDYILESFNNKKKKEKVLNYVTIPILLGIFIGFFTGKSLIDFLLDKYQMQLYMLFTGLFLGAIKILHSKDNSINIKTFIIFLISFLIAILLYKFCLSNYIIENSNILNVIYFALLFALSLFIPCISISAIFNYNILNNPFYIAIFIIITIVVIYIISKILYKVYLKYKKYLYTFLKGLVLANIVICFLSINNYIISFSSIFTSILALMWGYLFAVGLTKE